MIHLFLPLFAQEAPTGAQIFGVIGVISMLGSLVMTFYATKAHSKYLNEKAPVRTIEPDPLRVQTVKDLATISQLDLLEQQFDKRFDKIDERFKDVFKDIAQLSRDTISRHNDLLREVGKLRGAFDQSQQRHHPNG